jgi:hypothetical protein
MRRRAVLLALACFLAFGGSAAGAGGVPPIPRIPGKWSHAEINVTLRRVPHTLILDRGRIAQVTTSQLTLRAPDGSMPVIAITGQTVVTLDGRLASIVDLRRKMFVTTMRIDGGPAVRVRASSV